MHTCAHVACSSSSGYLYSLLFLLHHITPASHDDDALIALHDTLTQLAARVFDDVIRVGVSYGHT